MADIYSGAVQPEADHLPLPCEPLLLHSSLLTDTGTGTRPLRPGPLRFLGDLGLLLTNAVRSMPQDGEFNRVYLK